MFCNFPSRRLTNQKGFTLIELIMVMTLLGILSVTILADTGDVILNAERAAAQKVIAAVRSGLVSHTSRFLIDTGEFGFPPELNTVPSPHFPRDCTASYSCFGNVLQQPIVDGSWETNHPMTFTHKSSLTVCNYDSGLGSFDCL